MSELLAAVRSVNDELRRRYRLSLLDVVPSETPGYYTQKRNCGGRAGGCNHPLHSCVFNEGGCHHTCYVAFHGRRDSRGRWVSPFAEWRTIRRAHERGSLQVQAGDA
jgi:hypothetical protein